jgi:hypothetical protein
MFVCCHCCVLSGRGLCDELITRLEESYRQCCVVVCDLETSRMRRPWPALGRSATRKINYMENVITKDCVVEMSLSKFRITHIDRTAINVVRMTHYYFLLQGNFIGSITTIDDVVQLSLLIVE